MANGDESLQVADSGQPPGNYIPLTEYQPDQGGTDTSAQAQPSAQAQSNYIPLTEWDPNAPPPPPPPTQPSGAFGAGAREFIHGIPALAGGIAGGEYGAGIGAAVAPFLGPFAPLAPLGGALIGGVAGGYLGEKASDVAQKAVGFDDDQLRAANIQAHPYATFAGQVAPALGAFAPGRVAPIVRGASALIGGGMEAGQEYAQGQDLSDPANLARIGVSAAIGGALPVTRFGQTPRVFGRDPAAQRAAAQQLFEAAAREKANPPPPAVQPEFPPWTGEQWKPTPASPRSTTSTPFTWSPEAIPDQPLPWKPEPWSPYGGRYIKSEEPIPSWRPSPSQAPGAWTPGAWSPANPRAAHGAQPARPAGEPPAPGSPRDLPLGGGYAEAQATEPGADWQARNYGANVSHGTPGANAAGGTAQEMPPPIGGPHAGGHGPEDYSKTTQPTAPNQVASIDPTIGAVLQDAYRTRAAEPPAQPPPQSVQPAQAGGQWRDVGPNEIFQPGRRFQMDQTTERSQVFEPEPPARTPEPPARTPEPPAAAAPTAPAAPTSRLSLARQQDGSYVLFRGDEALGEYPNRGEALKAQNRERMRDIGARPSSAAPAAPGPQPVSAEDAILQAGERYRTAAAARAPNEAIQGPRPVAAPDPRIAINEHVHNLTAAGTDRNAFEPAFEALRRDVRIKKTEANEIAQRYTESKATWPSRQKALDEINNSFKERELEAVKMRRVDKASGFAPEEPKPAPSAERAPAAPAVDHEGDLLRTLSKPESEDVFNRLKNDKSIDDAQLARIADRFNGPVPPKAPRSRSLAAIRSRQRKALEFAAEEAPAKPEANPFARVNQAMDQIAGQLKEQERTNPAKSEDEALQRVLQAMRDFKADERGSLQLPSIWPTINDWIKAATALVKRIWGRLTGGARIGDIVRAFVADERGSLRIPRMFEPRQGQPAAKAPPADLATLTDRELAARGRNPEATAAEQNAIIAELQRRQAAQLGYGRTAPPSGPAARAGAPGMTTRPGGGTVRPGRAAPAAPQGAPPGGAAPPPPPTPPRAGGAAHPAGPAGAAGAAGPVPPFVSRATAADQQKGLIATIQRLLYPRGQTGFAGKMIQRAAMGQWQTLKDAAVGRLTKQIFQTANRMDRDKWGRIDPAMPQFRAFMKDFETGNISRMRPEWQPMANAMRKSYQDVETFLKGLPKFAQMQFVTDYANHMWAGNPQDKIDSMLSRLGGTSSGSLKKRTLPTYEDGFQAGLKPASPNPVEHLIRYLDAIGVPAQQAQMMRDLEAGNWIQWLKPNVIGASGVPLPVVRGGPPLGYDRLNVPWATRADGAQAWVPRDMAYTFHNQYNSTLRSGAYAPLFNAAQKIKNISTAVELGLSLYHLNTATTETLGLGIARAGRELGALRPDRALKEFLSAFAQTKEAPLAFIPGGGKYSYGQHLLDVQKGLKTGTPDEMRAFQALQNANLHLTSMISKGEYELTRLPDYFNAYMRGSLMNDIQDRLSAIKGAGTLGESAKLAVAAPFEEMARLAQTISKPIFQYAVPRMKMVAMMKDMQQYMFHNPHATDEELNTAAARIMDHVDNILGEANRDNLGMNRSLQDVGYLLLRSFAWTILGPGRGIVGGALSGIKGAIKGQNRLSPASPHYDPRVGYSLAFPFVIGSIGSLYNYAMTGQWPWETGDWHDYVMPRTGGTTRQGQPERLKIPGYQKDFIGYASEPSVEIPAKVAGIWRSIWEEMSNNEFPGQPIVPPNASPEEQLYYRGRHMLGASLPIGVKQQMQAPNPNTKVPLPAQIMGFSTPGRAYTDPSYVAGQEQRAERAWQRKARQQGFGGRFAQGGLITGYGRGGIQ